MSGSRNSPSSSRETNSPDGRSPAARAAAWASRIMTISLEMVLPGLAGYWLDTKLGTKFVLMLLGFALGSAAALKHLLYLTRVDSRRRSAPRPTYPEKERHT